MAYELLTFDVADRIATITVNRPDKLNALNDALMAELGRAIDDAIARDDVGGVLLTGAGRAFVAGADISEMVDEDALSMKARAERGQRTFRRFETSPKPTVAAVNGFALGGGCELALACDIRIASREARLGQPEVNLGIIPGWGGSQRLPRIVGLGFAKEIVFSGRAVEAQEAHDWGLVNQIYDPAELMPAAMKLAHELAKKSPLALAYAKEATNLYLTGEASAHMETELRLFAMLFSSEDQKEGMAAFAEKRPPNWVPPR